MRELQRIERAGVNFVGSLGSELSFGFTERTGGVSEPPFASLNLGDHVGDSPEAVCENRRRALAALGAELYAERLVVPKQVHGTQVIIITRTDAPSLARARTEAAAGADAIVCTVPGVPVMLCFADCVPIIITAPGGFAVAHSGWKGTIAGIASAAARVLMDVTGAAPSSLQAYLGPHILGDEYEVSAELAARFAERFSDPCPAGERLLDLGRCITQTLSEAGLHSEQVFDSGLSTLRLRGRFFSYRAEGPICGRHAALACLHPSSSTRQAGTVRDAGQAQGRGGRE